MGDSQYMYISKREEFPIYTSFHQGLEGIKTGNVNRNADFVNKGSRDAMMERLLLDGLTTRLLGKDDFMKCSLQVEKVQS